MQDTIAKITVDNMESPRTGHPVANQFEIRTEEGTYFQSYRSIIAFRPYNHIKYGATIILDETYWDYSRTTGKYRNEFLGEGIAETRRKIKTGEYKLSNLN